jgi:hypothetical protein
MTTVREVADRPGTAGIRFSRRVFTIAGIYGILVLAPQYFMEATIGRGYPWFSMPRAGWPQRSWASA